VRALEENDDKTADLLKIIEKTNKNMLHADYPSREKYSFFHFQKKS